MKLLRQPLKLGSGRNLSYKAVGILQYSYQITEKLTGSYVRGDSS